MKNIALIFSSILLLSSSGYVFAGQLKSESVNKNREIKVSYSKVDNFKSNVKVNFLSNKENDRPHLYCYGSEETCLEKNPWRKCYFKDNCWWAD